ncbi:aspartate aminotransferase family protein [Wolbachia endosymbiont of Diaphorina citri]|jgi:acetylornithine and succinylornithine aminotransferases|uniref:aspartate aminotransferase family protein n=1 Tax=Wolbachia endosymbiont of Diaphorina citri TaxID=116598 RepID=UPI000316CB6D|nr:aspartate aminotransferase family protein [Wolbachia endosymbiont of Diaphorina citri]QJT94523.1 aspartate aminotransferase family protein [Wolbachia endosymbiont of Diaphorina citri]QJT95763.1 aspartate aminotransferase family protein [Wolbachia endosymbiont of Diaphorina citri]QJT97125.1 aspartate aminotransferase family protein [Wolbachia endosymbiont of Diaphorina citri]QLK11421.1 aspartate aminotransferase family protein [Wolbachia endosymbiont of Diaphorina citri]QXY87048.1 aspartate 
MTTSPVLPVYSPINIKFSYGKGIYLYDIDNKRYIDFHSGIAVSSLGHANPRLTDVLKLQGEKLWHISNTYNISTTNKFAENLINNSFANTVFFANSGSEAVECGLKIARAYQNGKGNKNRYRILTFHGAFHGRTFLTCATNDRQKFSELLNPYIDWCDNIEPNIESVKKAISNGIGVILIEPIQGQGGIKVMSEVFMKELRELCNENDILLFFDCVQCGAGRTGKLFAYEHIGIKPDICALAKGIGGGFPLGACLATEKVAKYMAVGMHGSTFGGNPLATSVGNAVLDELLSPGFLENVEVRGKSLKNKLEDLASKFPMIEEVRGEGLMLGIKVKMNNQKFAEELSHRGLLTVGVTSDNVVRILPPLIITEKEIDEGIEILTQYLSEKF